MQTIHVAIVSAAIAVTGIGIAQAAQHNQQEPTVSASSVLTACVNKKTKAMRFTTKCKKSEQRVSWNATGPAGPLGPRGASGPRGATGYEGAAGPRGAAGDQGPSGSRGATGDEGPTRPRGATGAEGAEGPRGATGPAGPAGPAGDNVVVTDGNGDRVSHVLDVYLQENRVQRLISGGAWDYDITTGEISNPGGVYWASDDCSGSTFIAGSFGEEVANEPYARYLQDGQAYKTTAVTVQIPSGTSYSQRGSFGECYANQTPWTVTARELVAIATPASLDGPLQVSVN